MFWGPLIDGQKYHTTCSWDGFAGKVTGPKTWVPSSDLHSGKKELTPWSCDLTYTRTPPNSYMHPTEIKVRKKNHNISYNVFRKHSITNNGYLNGQPSLFLTKFMEDLPLATSRPRWGYASKRPSEGQSKSERINSRIKPRLNQITKEKLVALERF